MKLITVDEGNVTENDLTVYNIVLSAANKYGADPSISVEAEAFFVNLVAEYMGTVDGLLEWLDVQMPQHFIALEERPRWLQSSEWPFINGAPMIFVGQLDLSPKNQRVSLILGRRTVFYVFTAPKSSPTVIMQQD